MTEPAISSGDPKVLPAFMLDNEQIVARAFEKLGVGSRSNNSIDRNAIPVIACIARACLPIIGDHWQDVIAINEERKKSIEDEFESDAAEREVASLDAELDALRSKHRRLLALREAHTATDMACQRSSVVLDQAAQSLLKATSITAVADFLEERMRALEGIARPQMTRQTCVEQPSLYSTIRTFGCINDVARFTIEENVRNFVYDYSNGEPAIDYVSDALTDLAARLMDVNTPKANRTFSLAFWKVLSHAHVIKNLAKEAADVGGSCENATPTEIENILKQCQEIIRTKHGRLREVDNGPQSNTDVCDRVELSLLREQQSYAIQRLASQIEQNETLEEQLKALRDDVYVSQKLRSFESLLNMLHSQKSLFQPRQTYETLFPRSLRPTINILADLVATPSAELNQLAEALKTSESDTQLDAVDNKTALTYLATLERSVDASKLSMLSLAPDSTSEVLLEDHIDLLKAGQSTDCGPLDGI